MKAAVKPLRSGYAIWAACMLVLLSIIIGCAIKITVDACNMDEAQRAKVSRPPGCEYKGWFR